MATVASTVPSTARERQLAGLRPRWQKGRSGNPAGRPAGLARRIREATNDGADLIEFMTKVLKSEREKTADRITAATWLADRCRGRPAQSIELREGDGSDRWEQLANMTPEQRRELRVELLRRLEEETSEDGDAAPVERPALPAKTPER